MYSGDRAAVTKQPLAKHKASHQDRDLFVMPSDDCTPQDCCCPCLFLYLLCLDTQEEHQRKLKNNYSGVDRPQDPVAKYSYFNNLSDGHWSGKDDQQQQDDDGDSDGWLAPAAVSSSSNNCSNYSNSGSPLSDHGSKFDSKAENHSLHNHGGDGDNGGAADGSGDCVGDCGGD